MAAVRDRHDHPAAGFQYRISGFSGKEKYGTEFDEILSGMWDAATRHDALAFADAATRSARINQRFVPNPFHALLEDRIGEFGALGINIGHTGTVAGLLFDAADDSAMKAAASAAMELHHLLPSGTKVDITLTSGGVRCARCAVSAGSRTARAPRRVTPGTGRSGT